MQQNFTENFYGPEDTCWAKKVPEGSSEGSTTHQGAPGGPGAPRWVVPTSVASRTASLLYKYPQYSRNPRGVDENQFQPPQVPEPPDQI